MTKEFGCDHDEESAGNACSMCLSSAYERIEKLKVKSDRLASVMELVVIDLKAAQDLGVHSIRVGRSIHELELAIRNAVVRESA